MTLDFQPFNSMHETSIMVARPPNRASSANANCPSTYDILVVERLLDPASGSPEMMLEFITEARHHHETVFEAAIRSLMFYSNLSYHALPTLQEPVRRELNCPPFFRGGLRSALLYLLVKRDDAHRMRDCLPITAYGAPHGPGMVNDTNIPYTGVGADAFFPPRRNPHDLRPRLVWCSLAFLETYGHLMNMGPLLAWFVEQRKMAALLRVRNGFVAERYMIKDLARNRFAYQSFETRVERFGRLPREHVHSIDWRMYAHGTGLKPRLPPAPAPTPPPAPALSLVPPAAAQSASSSPRSPRRRVLIAVMTRNKDTTEHYFRGYSVLLKRYLRCPSSATSPESADSTTSYLGMVAVDKTDDLRHKVCEYLMQEFGFQYFGPCTVEADMVCRVRIAHTDAVEFFGKPSTDNNIADVADGTDHVDAAGERFRWQWWSLKHLVHLGCLQAKLRKHTLQGLSEDQALAKMAAGAKFLGRNISDYRRSSDLVFFHGKVMTDFSNWRSPLPPPPLVVVPPAAPAPAPAPVVHGTASLLAAAPVFSVPVPAPRQRGPPSDQEYQKQQAVAVVVRAAPAPICKKNQDEEAASIYSFGPLRWDDMVQWHPEDMQRLVQQQQQSPRIYRNHLVGAAIRVPPPPPALVKRSTIFDRMSSYY